ncbi:hypothetical protein [Sphingomonas oligophenolica]|uniref:Uncharacterized protein n=1 Tax=Sphingomonas oligophenolica TaxID=301154 RepID=A0A502CTQ6_9SPHN|nr:hypothetical protein [Sphingomonas oligophenolica]TPG15489.1 hypothetical protein EAH84_01400 [Sphingomonas oligophenolica]
MRMATWSFALAGVYGLAATLSLYFRAPLTIETQWLYAFAGAAAVTQLAYLLIATDPVRYRLVIPIGIASKLSFAVPMTILYAHGAITMGSFAFAQIDYALAALFAVNFVRLPNR